LPVIFLQLYVLFLIASGLDFVVFVIKSITEHYWSSSGEDTETSHIAVHYSFLSFNTLMFSGILVGETVRKQGRKFEYWLY